MVAVSSPAKVLVTGSNGYLATSTWVVKSCLEAGYSVRGTVRSLARSAFLKDRFGHYGDRFELVVVEGIARDGAFDEAVKDVDTIAHSASPFDFTAAGPDDPIVPEGIDMRRPMRGPKGGVGLDAGDGEPGEVSVRSAMRAMGGDGDLFSTQAAAMSKGKRRDQRRTWARQEIVACGRVLNTSIWVDSVDDGSKWSTLHMSSSIPKL